MRRWLLPIMLIVGLYIYRARITRYLSTIRISPQLVIGLIGLIGLIVLPRILFWLWSNWRRTHRRQNLTRRVDGIPAATLSPDEFEILTAKLFESKYQVKATVQGGAGDGGIDVRLTDWTGSLWGIVQCKRYQPDKTLPPTHLRDLDSCKRRLGVSRAWLVTTAGFSDSVKRDAARWGIELIDGIEFERMRSDSLLTR